MNVRDVLLELGFSQQVGMAAAINAIDDRFGEGSGNRITETNENDEPKSWGEVTDDDWSTDPSMTLSACGTEAEILQAYADLRRGGVRGWLSVTTRNWITFSIWRPVGEAA